MAPPISSQSNPTLAALAWIFWARTSAGRLLLVHSTQISEKQTKTTAGVAVVTLKKNQTITDVRPADQLELANPHRYRVRTLPAAGALLRSEDLVEQTSLGE